jgi:vacuolar-type H+-ATPase subunit E/Vma4
MALADLISRLEREAQDRVQAIQDKADAEVRAIEESTEKAVAEIMAHQFERERAERHLGRQRELAVAWRQARTRELEAQRLQIARVLNRARTFLAAIATSPAYAAAVPTHLDEALSFLHGLQPRVRCQAVFAAVLQAAVNRHEGSQLVIDESTGPGFVAEASDGSVVVDNTLAARLARAETRLTIELARKLADGA